MVLLISRLPPILHQSRRLNVLLTCYHRYWHICSTEWRPSTASTNASMLSFLCLPSKTRTGRDRSVVIPYNFQFVCHLQATTASRCLAANNISQPLSNIVSHSIRFQTWSLHWNHNYFHPVQPASCSGPRRNKCLKSAWLIHCVKHSGPPNPAGAALCLLRDGWPGAIFMLVLPCNPNATCVAAVSAPP